MGRQSEIGDLFRVQLRHERERRGWSQAQVASILDQRYQLSVFPSTIAKIESGNRDVRVDELFAFADLFGVSVDVLLGRRGSGGDAVWAAERLSSNAGKMASDIFNLRERIDGDIDDLAAFADRDKRFESVRDLIAAAHWARTKLEDCRAALSAVAGEFPLPGLK